jgi:hypothetical protein
MVDRTPGKTDRARWRDIIIGHLGDFPRQCAALESAMSTFGDDFELAAFKDAFDFIRAYRRWIEPYISAPRIEQ